MIALLRKLCGTEHPVEMRVVTGVVRHLQDMQRKHCIQETLIIGAGWRLEIDTSGIPRDEDTLPGETDAGDVAELVARRNRPDLGRDGDSTGNRFQCLRTKAREGPRSFSSGPSLDGASGTNRRSGLRQT
jgi:hypothetical protein